MRPENPIGFPFFELSEVDSSNNYAMQKVQAQMAAHGTTYFAHYQNSGKGQRGKTWNAEPGQNIMMSCVLNPYTLSIDNQFILNAAVALACHDFFQKYAVDDTSIKWPNDIYWRDRKAGGILIENVLKGKEWKYSIAGIGININQTLFPSLVRNPVSLKQITGKTYNSIDMAKELCHYLEKYFCQLLGGKYNDLIEEYNLHLYKRHETATFKKENAIFNAVINGVNKRGELLIDTGQQLAIAFGTIEWVST